MSVSISTGSVSILTTAFLQCVSPVRAEGYASLAEASPCVATGLIPAQQASVVPSIAHGNAQIISNVLSQSVAEYGALLPWKAASFLNYNYIEDVLL